MRIVFFPAALLASTTAMASVAIDGWYASIFGGYSYVPDNISTNRWNVHIANSAYDNGYNVGGRVGYQCTPLRYEAEVTYQNATLDHFDIDRVRQVYTNGDTNQVLAMANVYYDFPEIVPAFNPFVGIGIGYAYVDASLNGNGPWYITRFRGSDSVFAYQGTGGFTYNFSEAYAVNAAYRYVGAAIPDELGKAYQSNMGSIGVIYRFDSVRYK